MEDTKFVEVPPFENEGDKYKEDKRQVWINILFLVLAALEALVFPIVSASFFFTSASDLAGQWYLSGTVRVITTIIMAICTYGAAFILLKYGNVTWFKRFWWLHIICGVLTLMWCILIGFIWWKSI